jgi:hypothetical protein
MSNDQSDRYAIIPIPPGPAPAEAIVTGNIDQVFEYIPQSVARDDAMKELDQARLTLDQIAHAQERTRAVQALMLNEALDRLTTRQDSFATKQRERRKEAKARRDAAEARRIQAALDALPDPDDPHAFASTPSKIRDDEPPASVGEPLRADLSKEPEPNLEIEGDQSTLPNELLEGVPPAPSTYPNSELPKPPVVSQPVSISLNKE